MQTSRKPSSSFWPTSLFFFKISVIIIIIAVIITRTVTRARDQCEPSRPHWNAQPGTPQPLRRDLLSFQRINSAHHD